MIKKILLISVVFLQLMANAQAPTVTLTQPTCSLPTGTAVVTSPLSSSGNAASNLFISEVTDAATGGLSYIELFNSTGATVNLSNYKLKIHLNGSATASCDLPLSGTLSTNSVFVVSVGSVTNVGGVTPNLTFPSCAGINNNDYIQLTNLSDVTIDSWGATDGSVFTPLGQPGYVYRRHNTALAPSLIWNPADWDAIDPEIYSNVGSYSTSVNYTYSLDGGAYQASPTFTQLAPGTHTIMAQNTTVGLTTPITTIQINPVVPCLAYFSYNPPFFCNDTLNNNPTPILGSGSCLGTFTAVPSGLDINPFTGTINLFNSLAGYYTVINTIAASGGCPEIMSSSQIAITSPCTADFSYSSNTYCKNDINPTAILGSGSCPSFFTFVPSGLDMNDYTGEINLANSFPGSYSIFNTIPASNGCSQVSSSVTIQILSSITPTGSSTQYNIAQCNIYEYHCFATKCNMVF
jgi:hypothetical protein